jgi:ABC-2 type transport system ATP-binding protein
LFAPARLFEQNAPLEAMLVKPIIEVEDLTKRYARHTAVQGLTFTVGRGEVVGLLGPNGAGKTTTMRVLSCFLPATSGVARVAGFNVFSEADEVRRRIGYMPENNPLHTDMRVCDYLRFRARLKGLTSRRCRIRTQSVMEMCGLTDVHRKIIGHLSKGYRQRVGLADALVHEPELIILDEPTIGLDPHQVRQVRQLIKGLARHHTVLISTHILSEVEMTCTRVLIMQQGRIVAADTTQNLQAIMSDGGQVIAEIAASMDDLCACWEQMPEIEFFDVSAVDGPYHRSALTPRSGLDLRPFVFDQVRLRGWELRELSRSRYSLEDIFVHLTRARPDDEGEEEEEG